MDPKARLSRILKSQKIPHALLLSGPRGSGKQQAAHTFAQELLQTKKAVHPDIHVYSPEGKTGMHPISTIRKLSSDVMLSPFEAQWKVFIVQEAERMLPTSSHAFLKTLEEPSAHTVIILLSHHAERLLSTIRSRCQMIEFSQSSTVYGNPILISMLSSGVPNHQLSELETEDADSIFEAIMLWHRDRLLLELGGSEELLNFPNHLSEVRNTPLIPLEAVEKSVKQAHLAYERSTKLSTCLEMLCLKIYTGFK